MAIPEQGSDLSPSQALINWHCHVFLVFDSQVCQLFQAKA